MADGKTSREEKAARSRSLPANGPLQHSRDNWDGPRENAWLEGDRPRSAPGTPPRMQFSRDLSVLAGLEGRRP